MSTLDKVKSAIGLKVVGKVNLEEIPKSTHPEKVSKEERDAQRQKNLEAQQEHNREVLMNDLKREAESIKQQMEDTRRVIDTLRQRKEFMKGDFDKWEKERAHKQLNLNYLTSRRSVRKKYNDFSLDNSTRQKELKFNGVRPKNMDVVHFYVAKAGATEAMDGVALVKDENHYYLAVDMYPRPEHPDNLSTCMDENPDGTFEGIWPKNVVLREAGKFEEKYMRNLADKYAADLKAADETIALADAGDKDGIEILKQNIEELDDLLSDSDKIDESIAKANEELMRLAGQANDVSMKLIKYEKGTIEEEVKEKNNDDEEEFKYVLEDLQQEEADSEIEKQFPHLPYLRGKRQMMDMSWPAIDTDFDPWLRFRLMSNVARLIGKAKMGHALTYVLSEDYYEEMSNRGKMHYRGMTFHDVVAEDHVVSAALIIPNQGHKDCIIFDINNRSQMTVIMVYVREGRLMFYESYSEQEIIGSPRIDSWICKSLRDSGTDINRLFSWLRNLIVSFLAMESDMERTVNVLVEEGKGEASEEHIDVKDKMGVADDRDIVIRDVSWYTDITVNREIPVRGYISHRWCGTGKDKYIKEVWVKPHVKNGYHRAAEVKKEN